MSGFDFVVDTNFLIAIHEGKTFTKPFLDHSIAVSVISEIELLGWHKITDLEKRRLKALLEDCILIDINTEIRDLAIRLRQKQNIRVPDAIVAATSQFLEVPLITSDKDFKKIHGLELILIS